MIRATLLYYHQKKSPVLTVIKKPVTASFKGRPATVDGDPMPAGTYISKLDMPPLSEACAHTRLHISLWQSLAK